MKFFIILLLCLLCFCDSSGNGSANNQNNSANRNNSNTTWMANLGSGNLNDNSDLKSTNARAVVIRKDTPPGRFKVNVYIDNKLTFTDIYDDGVLRESKYHAPEKDVHENDKESVTKYYYKENGELDRAETTDGIAGDDDFSKKIESDSVFYYEQLKSKNIEIPFPELISGEINDTAKILSVGDSENKFKQETKTVGNQKTVKFTGMDGTINFYPSEFSTYVYRTQPIKSYELILKDNHLFKETYEFVDTIYTREYFYDGDKLVKLIFTANFKGETSVTEKKFEYQKID